MCFYRNIPGMTFLHLHHGVDKKAFYIWPLKKMFFWYKEIKPLNILLFIGHILSTVKVWLAPLQPGWGSNFLIKVLNVDLIILLPNIQRIKLKT